MPTGPVCAENNCCQKWDMGEDEDEHKISDRRDLQYNTFTICPTYESEEAISEIMKD